MPASMNVKNVFVGLTGEDQQNGTSYASCCGLSLAVVSGAHLSARATSRRLVKNSALVGFGDQARLPIPLFLSHRAPASSSDNAKVNP